MIKCSIICNTYNHEKTIEQAIKGFLFQKVDFTIEILIHDDASTDNTQSIIKKYENLYPELIKPIYQTFNQTQQGKSVSLLNISRAQGEYIAICEGDDVWIDSLKLHKQISFLDDHLEFECVGHACEVKNVNFPFKSRIWSYSNLSKELTTQEIILNRGIVFAYSTLIFRYPSVEYPSFFGDFKVADIKRIIFTSILGKVYYLNNVMSRYNVGVSGSWTERVRLNNDLLVKHYRSEIRFYENLESYTKDKYTDEIKSVINRILFLINLLEFDVNCFNSIEFRKLKLDRKISIYFQYYFPTVFNLVRRLRYKYWV